MARIRSKNLFDLIKSLSKNEKRYFQVINNTSANPDDKKMILLFDIINNQKEFDEEKILAKEKSIKPSQLSNLKAYLYKKVLEAIRQFNSEKILDIRIREQIDFAQLLIDRRLFNQAEACLEKAKKMAISYQKYELQLEIIKLEKSLLSETIDADNINKVDKLIAEVRSINSIITNITLFSNLSIKLNSLYTKTGYIRDENDYQKVKEFFNSNIPALNENNLSIAELLHLYRLYTGYYFFIQDFENGYSYAKKSVAIFQESTWLIKADPEAYIKALNHLLISQYKLFKYPEFVDSNKILLAFSQENSLHLNENIRIRLLKYFFIHEINKFFMTGDFEKGVETMLVIKGEEIEGLMKVLDLHSSLILSYKIACLHFGAGNFSQALRWLNKIINLQNVDIREDLHCFARIINLICHFELGNYDVINHYIISTYRFLLKKDDLRSYQKYILGFLRNLKKDQEQELSERFEKLKAQLTPLMGSPYEKRAFIYFDIISWLQSKIEKRAVQDVIKSRLANSRLELPDRLKK